MAPELGMHCLIMSHKRTVGLVREHTIEESNAIVRAWHLRLVCTVYDNCNGKGFNSNT